MVKRPLMVKRVGGVLAALVLVTGLAGCGDDEATTDGPREHAAQPVNPDGAPCTYAPGTGAPVEEGKEVDPPAETAAYTGTVEGTIETNKGDIGITLDATTAPCAVNAVTSLASQGFYDDTPCPRVTTNPQFGVLQCGSGNDTTSGGPGYTYADELTGTETYPAGTIAMANAGADTNGSQFFLVFNDSGLDPAYVVVGSIDAAGIDVLQAIGEAGTAEGTEDGEPAEPVTIDFFEIGDATDGPGVQPYSPASSCDYPADGSGGTTEVDLPPTTPVAEDVTVALATSAGPIAMELDGDFKPCTVGSFVSLAEQGYFDSTSCPRLTTEASGISVLQCGRPRDPAVFGPGYSFADELEGTETYPAGTVAMANGGPGTNGSEFFLVYEESPLDPDYTVFGTLTDSGLRTVRQVAAAGEQTGQGDGAPVTPVNITRVELK